MTVATLDKTEVKIARKLALRADLCYNTTMKYGRQSRADNTLWHITSTLLRRLATMDTLPPHADTGNIPLKRCSSCPEGQQWHPATLEFFSRQKDGFKSQCKRCQVAYRAAYYAAHREEEKQRMAEYGAAHREELRQYSAQYRASHSEEVRWSQSRYNATDQRRQSKARYNASHREKVRQYNVLYRAEHREEQRQYSAEYNATHHDERIQYGVHRRLLHREELNEKTRAYRHTERGRMLHRAHENRRHARKREVYGVLTVEQIQEKLKAQHYRCYYAACGYAKFERVKGRYIFHLEHTIPVSRSDASPRHDINYVVLSCPSCNLKKNDKLPHEWIEGGRLL